MTKRDLDKEAQIVAFVDSGDYTLENVGAIYGVTRERVRQLYKRATGGKRVTAKQAKNKLLTLAKKEAYLDQPKYECASCGQEVLRRAKQLTKYCRKCNKIYKLEHRDVMNTRYCTQCGKRFHPYLNMKSPSQSQRSVGMYCSRKCYLASPNAMYKKELGLFICQDCGKEFDKMSPPQRYCKKCAYERILTRHRKRYWDIKLGTNL